MKKHIFLLASAAVMAGATLLTGCKKEKSFSSYEIAVTFSGLPKNENGTDFTSEEIEKLPAEQRDLYHVADYLVKWMINNVYVRTYGLGNPLIIEGEDLAYNDQQAYKLFTNEVQRLDAANLDKVIADAQQSGGLELTTSGSVSFSYLLTRTSTLPDGTQLSKRYTVNYAPTANPE
ncbi:MAG: hypothetical protein J1E79_07490 [Rikenella sp.]|nr:hypothetical protein [Rikenella sp.]